MGGAMRLWLLGAGIAVASSGYAQDMSLEQVQTQTVHADYRELSACLAIALNGQFRTWLQTGLTKVDLQDERRSLLTAQPRDSNEPLLWQLQFQGTEAATELALYVPTQAADGGPETADILAPFISGCIKKSARGTPSRVSNPQQTLLGCWLKASFNKRARLPSSVTFCFRPHGKMIGMSFDIDDGWDWPAQWKLVGGNKITILEHTCALSYHRQPKAIALADCEIAGAYDWQGPYKQ